MALVSWSDQYRTGIASIDDAHEQLFNLLNRLQENLRQGAPVAQTLTALKEHAGRHFQDEEAHMAASAYPGLDAHKAEHAELLQQVQAFQQQHAVQPEAANPGELGVFLVDWVLHHILGFDKQYADSLKAAD